MSTTVQNISIFPDELFESGVTECDESQWWALYTKARHEKALARAAAQCEVPFFLPLIREQKYSRGRRYSVQAPMFPGYFFLWGTEEQRVWSLTTNHVSRVLTTAEPARLTADLARIHRLIQSDTVLTPERRLQPGKRVLVRSGPLAGMEGTVLVRRGETRLLVSVDFLQQGASVEVDDFMLEEIV